MNQRFDRKYDDAAAAATAAANDKHTIPKINEVIKIKLNNDLVLWMSVSEWGCCMRMAYASFKCHQFFLFVFAVFVHILLSGKRERITFDTLTQFWLFFSLFLLSYILIDTIQLRALASNLTQSINSGTKK